MNYGSVIRDYIKNNESQHLNKYFGINESGGMLQGGRLYEITDNHRYYIKS